MSRLIDADALMKAMYHRAFETDGDTMWQSGCWVRYRAIEQIVKEQPTVELEQQSFITFDDITLYKCDPAKNTSCKKSGCYVNGGPCKLTRHKEYREE